MGHPFDVRCCKVNIFFSFAHHVSYFFLFFSAAIRHIAQSGIYFRRIIPAWLLPASHHQSYSLSQSILQPPTINPTASRHHSSCLPQSILLPPTITPPAFRHQSYGLPQSLLQPLTINPPASHHLSSCLPAYSLSIIIWPSFIMCRYLSCSHPYPGDYLFSDICPPQDESPVCQYGPDIRQ